MERLKLSCTSQYFTKHNNVVTCHAKFCSKKFNYYLETTGRAICAEDDKYDYEKGKRLARCRAEMYAFAQFRGWLDHCYIPKLLDFVDATMDIRDNMNKYTEHQKEYIKSF